MLGLSPVEPDPADRRIAVLTLTRRGRRAVDADVEARVHWLGDQLDELTPDQRAVLRHATQVIDTILAGQRAAGAG